MKKSYVFIILTGLISTQAFAADAATSTSSSTSTSASTQPKDPCHIEVFEKTPNCYVTDEGNGCLTISDQKPVCSKNSCTFAVPGCEVKTTYQSDTVNKK